MRDCFGVPRQNLNLHKNDNIIIKIKEIVINFSLINKKNIL